MIVRYGIIIKTPMRCLRCTFGYDLSDKGNRNLNFRVGYVF